MIKKLVNEAALKYILNDIELSCRRLGINAQFSLNEDKDYKGKLYEKIVSNSFQTMPMLFKEVHIEGEIMAVDSDGVIKVVINLEYRYQTFNDGYFGCSLGRIIYNIDKSYNGKRADMASMYIDKEKSINI